MSTTSETTKRTAPAARWPLGRRTRQTVLVVHNGLGIDDDGNLLVAQPYATSVADIKTGNPFGERSSPGCRVSRASGSLKVGHTQRLTIKVSWSRVPDGVTGARLEIRGNGGARTRVVVPITLRR